MPRPTARRSTMHRHAARRPVARLASVLLVAGALVALPGGPGPGTVTAARPERLAAHATKLEVVGRASIRALARREAVGRPETVPGMPPIPTRLGWLRNGRTAPAGGGTGESVDASAPAAVIAAAIATAQGPTGAGGSPDADAASTAGPATGADDAGTAALDVGTDATGTAPAALAAGGPGVVGTAWNGLTDQAIGCGSSRPCLEPPDPWVAVSATHVVQMVNQSTRITTRAGSGATQVSNRAFFGVTAWSSSAFAADPRVLYDPAHDRWVATLFAGTCSGGALFVAVSDTGDPTGSWQRYYRAFAGRWPDFPTLGYSSSLVAVGVNEFGVSCGTGGTSVIGAYEGTSLHVMDWADLLDGGGLPAISSSPPDPAAFTFVPAAGLTPGDAVHVVVALDDGSESRADLGYATISGTVGGGDLLISAPVSLSGLPLAKLQQPPTPVDAGGPIGLQRNALDLRPTDAVWRDGRLAVASTTSCPRGTSSRPCGRVTELATQADLSTPALRQDLRIAATSGYTDTFMPGVGYSDDGTLWTVFSQGGSGTYVSSWARRQAPGATPGSWSAGAALIAAGRGPYGGTAGAGLNQRWGDYVGVARDPAEPGSVWQANQLADTGGGWATRVARLGDDTTPPTVGAPRASFVSGTQAGRTSIPVRISWSAADPGSGVATTRLERSLNGGAFAAVSLASATARSVTQSLAYGARYRYRVTATDNAGNETTTPIEGSSFTPTLYSEGYPRVAYGGTWTVARSTSYLGKASRYATVARRRATITFSGFAVAWVSTAARTHGSARVYADGVLQGTYSTYRSTTVYRRVVTGRAFATPGTHTYRVEVVGTAGHPRVDVDSFIVLR